jgi:hypothetical protein
MLSAMLIIWRDSVWMTTTQHQMHDIGFERVCVFLYDMCMLEVVHNNNFDFVFNYIQKKVFLFFI